MKNYIYIDTQIYSHIEKNQLTIKYVYIRKKQFAKEYVFYLKVIQHKFIILKKEKIVVVKKIWDAGFFWVVHSFPVPFSHR